MNPQYIASSDISWFADQESTDKRAVGGKAANLGILTQGGFAVPSGFTVTTAAYSRFLTTSGLEGSISTVLSQVSYDIPESIEEVTSSIRELISASSIPHDLEIKIRQAYQTLGDCLYVAVRSSGAAEDLEEASFAGLHDTYLDIRGEEELLDAIKRCWASVWTSRATSYRQTKTFDHFAAPIAVVVQEMVKSEVSGVMFTANPMTTATDEIVINASWGLGEAVVQGITTPDTFILRSGTLSVLDRNLGSKSLRIVRNPETGRGIVTEDTPSDEKIRYSLSDPQIAELGDLGQRIQQHYDGFPQDIEWGFANGKFFVLQARPITGVELSWDADVNASVPGTAPDDQIWSRNFADEAWTGAVTPLMFSWRAVCMNMGHSHCMQMLGFPELDFPEMRLWQFHKGKCYFNLESDRKQIEMTVPPLLRNDMLLSKLPASMHDELKSENFSYERYARMYFRLQTMAPEEGLGWSDNLVRVVNQEAKKMGGYTDEKLRSLSDGEIKKYIDEMIEIEGKRYDVVWTGLMIMFRDLIGLLQLLIAKWYDGENKNIFTDIISGTRERTVTAVENLELWKLSQKIRNSKTLRDLFEQHQDKAFFENIAHCADGRDFLQQYEQFVSQHGHRGHADRDIYFIRRAEDPSVDYRPLKAMLTVADPQDPEAMEEVINVRREQAIDDAIKNIQGKAFGPLKAEIFKLVIDYLHKFIVGRDNERHFFDRSTFAIKKGFIEISRRCVGKGILESERDFYFLTRPELYDVLDGRANPRLSKAKIAARMRDFDRVDSKEITPPYFIQRGKAINVGAAAEIQSGALRGIGTSRGNVVGIARVVKTLKEIGSIKSGDILVTNSTDPGWTPVFLMIKGIVLETGGILAHGSLLAREYGFPAVQIDDAIRHIPDGAMISIDGDAGIVQIIDSVPNETELAVA